MKEFILTFGTLAILSCYSTAHAQDITQVARIGALSAKVPADAVKPETYVKTTPMKIERTSRYHSESLRGCVTLTYIEYQAPLPPQQRLAAYLTEFIESYGSIEHLVGVAWGAQEITVENHKGMNITTKVGRDNVGVRYTFVETRILADTNKVFLVTVETEASDVVPSEAFRAKAVTEIFSSMKVQ